MFSERGAQFQPQLSRHFINEVRSPLGLPGACGVNGQRHRHPWHRKRLCLLGGGEARPSVSSLAQHGVDKKPQKGCSLPITGNPLPRFIWLVSCSPAGRREGHPWAGEVGAVEVKSTGPEIRPARVFQLTKISELLSFCVPCVFFFKGNS